MNDLLNVCEQAGGNVAADRGLPHPREDRRRGRRPLRAARRRRRALGASPGAPPRCAAPGRRPRGRRGSRAARGCPAARRRSAGRWWARRRLSRRSSTASMPSAVSSSSWVMRQTDAPGRALTVSTRRPSSNSAAAWSSSAMPGLIPPLGDRAQVEVAPLGLAVVVDAGAALQHAETRGGRGRSRRGGDALLEPAHRPGALAADQDTLGEALAEQLGDARARAQIAIRLSMLPPPT